MELVLDKLIISVSIIKKVSIAIMILCMNMLTLSVPSITPNISVLPVINGQQVSLTISVDVSFHILTFFCMSYRLVICVLVNIRMT